MRGPKSRRGPTSRDLSRIALARASSRVAIARARESFADAALAAFRREIGATVRRVSPFLTAMLEGTGLSMDDVADGLRPAAEWPDRSGVPAFLHLPRADPVIVLGSFPDALRGRPAPHPAPLDLPGTELVSPAGERLHVHVVDHSIEAAGRVGEHWFVSLFGMLCVEVPRRPGERLPVIRAGSRLEDGLDVPATLRRGWLVEKVMPADDLWGLKLAVRTGGLRYRPPWARRARQAPPK